MPALERVVATPKVHDMQCHYYDIMSRIITLHNVTLILLTFFSPAKYNLISSVSLLNHPYANTF